MSSGDFGARRYWFKRVRSGEYALKYIPCSWEGWVSMVVMIGLMLGNFWRVNATLETNPERFLNEFLPITGILALVLVLIVWRTGKHTIE